MELADFSGQVPTGVLGRPERVIVVGAGMAGLTAANALVNAGIDTVVLEGRDRLGGRLHTIGLDGAAVDLGGSWIHEPDGNPMARWADELGVERRPANLLDDAAIWHSSMGLLRGPPAERLRKSIDQDLYGILEALTSELGADAPMDRVVEACVSRAAARSGEHDPSLVRALLLTFVEQDGGAVASDVALGGFPSATHEYGGDYLGDMPVGGYARLVTPLAAGVDVRLGRRVTRVGVSPSGVLVTDDAGRSEAGSHAVMTVPLGVLKAGTIRFEPALPATRLDAIARLGVGRFEKVAMRFDSAFWSAADVSNVITLSSDHQTPAAFVGLDHLAGAPVLLAFAFGSAVPSVAKGSPDEALARMLALLAEVFGRPIPEPRAFARTQWTSDPFARGAYGYVPRGAHRRDLDSLGEPLWGRLLFAGEATSSSRVGYADGAMTSGAREAVRLLARESVRVTPLV